VFSSLEISILKEPETVNSNQIDNILYIDLYIGIERLTNGIKSFEKKETIENIEFSSRSKLFFFFNSRLNKESDKLVFYFF
jgi:hypothetical protein